MCLGCSNLSSQTSTLDFLFSGRKESLYWYTVWPQHEQFLLIGCSFLYTAARLGISYSPSICSSCPSSPVLSSYWTAATTFVRYSYDRAFSHAAARDLALIIASFKLNFSFSSNLCLISLEFIPLMNESLINSSLYSDAVTYLNSICFANLWSYWILRCLS